MHAIGDYAAEVILDSFEAAGITAKDRPLLTHCQILGADLFDKMVKLGNSLLLHSWRVLLLFAYLLVHIRRNWKYTASVRIDRQARMNPAFVSIVTESPCQFVGRKEIAA